jgi:hypothetical protein
MFIILTNQDYLLSMTNLHVDSSACQEKYLRELSVTPVGYFTGAKSLPWAWGVPATGTILHGVNEYFRATGMIFPRLPLHLMEFEGIWGQYLQLEVNKMV